jgi:hypothetical protein
MRATKAHEIVAGLEFYCMFCEAFIKRFEPLGTDKVNTVKGVCDHCKKAHE